MSSDGNCETKVKEIDDEITRIEKQISSLQHKKFSLEKSKAELLDSVSENKALKLASLDWENGSFEWTVELKKTLRDVFNLTTFRQHQLSAINASMSGHDTILIMPTGGGKSLCYQLPALVSDGITLVVSPLIALMEDQLIGLKRLNVNAALLNASSTKEEVKTVHNAMIDKNSNLKLLYVTPEKLAKSKTFMAKLQKMFALKRFARLAIDEVHCCSQWGHDFRPDYKFLNVFRGLFPGVPIMGLTATATSQVIQDVKKILGLPSCLVFKASFNRPNLYYEVRAKPSTKTDFVDALADLLQNRFKGQSGIIYATTVKESEDLTEELRKRKIRVGCYHANVDSKIRSQIHQKWLSNEYQAVVATIAFGMGIDKPDVRFVIHHSISKSMENFYQESGRAGRDDSKAYCIVFYRLADVFKLSGMVFTEQTGLCKLYAMASYGIDSYRCRRNIIAEHFGEQWETSQCNHMCDHCTSAARKTRELDITDYCSTLYSILEHAQEVEVRVTGQKLLDAWLGKGQVNLRVAGVVPPLLERDECEKVIAFLLIEGYLKEDFHFTPYSTISYLLPGNRRNSVKSGKNRICMLIKDPSPELKDNKSTPSITVPSESTASKGPSKPKKRKIACVTVE